MDNYVKGENVETEDTLETIPIQGLPADCTWMKIKPGTKLRNVIGYAKKDLATKGLILISGHGNAVTKAISLGEIVKRGNRALVQYTQIAFKVFEEHWDPKSEDLDPLKVVREVPQIFIVLSKEPVPDLDLEPQRELRQFLDFNSKAGNSYKPPKKRGNRHAAERLGVTNPKKPQGGGQFNAPKPRNGPRPNPKPESTPNPKANRHTGNDSVRHSKPEAAALNTDAIVGKENKPEGTS
ncbi:ribonuclease P protein subunit p25-like protein [Tigriopus californicus]|nr:ribonuclease P protein subunit p25-like protein [Tigriopus californicus]